MNVHYLISVKMRWLNRKWEETRACVNLCSQRIPKKYSKEHKGLCRTQFENPSASRSYYKIYIYIITYNYYKILCTYYFILCAKENDSGNGPVAELHKSAALQGLFLTRGSYSHMILRHPLWKREESSSPSA